MALTDNDLSFSTASKMRTLDSSVTNFGRPLPTFRSGLVSYMLVEFSNLHRVALDTFVS